jgi:erythromycin esterase
VPNVPITARTAIAVLALVASACGADPASPRETPTPPPPPTPPISIPTDRLLTDAELVTSLDSLAPTEPDARVAWAKGAAHPIRSLTYDGDFSDLRFLATALQGKRLVQLGESGHGVSEFSLAKVRLIKYLHEELGYDVIAFESSLFACWDADARAESLGGAGLLQSCPFGVWHTAEVLPLFEYVASTKKTARPLTLAGFDVQFSTPADARRSALVRRVLGAAGDTVTANHWAAFDSTFWAAYRTATTADVMGAYVGTNYDALTGGYDSLAAAIVARRPALEAASGRAPVAVALQSVRGMRAFLDQLRAFSEPRVSNERRDRGMANNVDFVLDSLYPGKKVITWAHNFHIRNDGLAVEPEPTRNMGSWVAARRRAETYTVGFYMYRGAAATNSRVAYSVLSPRDANTLETILYSARLRFAFYDVLHEPQTAGSRWLWDLTRALDWGTVPYTMVIRDQYDGIVFIDTTTQPKYL